MFVNVFWHDIEMAVPVMVRAGSLRRSLTQFLIPAQRTWNTSNTFWGHKQVDQGANENLGPDLPKRVGLLTFWFCRFGPFVMATKGDRFHFWVQKGQRNWLEYLRYSEPGHLKAGV